jgi:hypothetical protein
MAEQQLDLFSRKARSPASSSCPAAGQPVTAPSSFADADLIALLPTAGIVEVPLLAMEAGRRRLRPAIPALEALCRRFAGFGVSQAVPEQEAAFEALAMIGGQEGKQVLARMIFTRVVQGPSLSKAVTGAARLKIILPAALITQFLQDDDARLRAAACGCVPLDAKVIERLVECLQDHEPEVRLSAACALGRLGRKEALSPLTQLLQQDPSPESIDAVTLVADEDCIILLGRIARTRPDLKIEALDALGAIDHPTASTLSMKLRAGSDR